MEDKEVTREANQSALTPPARPRRRERVPLGVERLKLSAPPIPGYVQRVINDTPGRIQDALNAGYEFVMKDGHQGMGEPDLNNKEAMGSAVSRIVGTHRDGSPMTGYLMKLKKEWYEEDQKKKAMKTNEREAALKRGNDKFGKVGLDGRYIPMEGISIEHKKD